MTTLDLAAFKAMLEEPSDRFETALERWAKLGRRMPELLELAVQQAAELAEACGRLAQIRDHVSTANNILFRDPLLKILNGDAPAETRLPAFGSHCICSTTGHDYGSQVVYELNADAYCPVHGEQAIADKRLLDAAETRAQVLRDGHQFGSGSAGWYDRDRESDREILAASDARRALGSGSRAERWLEARKAQGFCTQCGAHLAGEHFDSCPVADPAITQPRGSDTPHTVLPDNHPPCTQTNWCGWPCMYPAHGPEQGCRFVAVEREGEVFDRSAAPGGYVCAEPVAEDQPGIVHDGQRVCGTPAESEPCPDHGEGQEGKA